MPTKAHAVAVVVRVLALTIAAVMAQSLATSARSQPEATPRPLGISLSPAVVMLNGQPGQAHRQTLRLTNHTSTELAFSLEAQDVVAEDGQRVFTPAGERADSIAVTAVFSPTTIVILPGQVGSADVTLTVPNRTAVRAVAAVFRGHTPVNPRTGVAMTASLGCLITFTLSNDIRVEPLPATVSAQSESTNLAVRQLVVNVGTEPAIPSGTLAVLNTAGVLVGKAPVEAQRLMPGERLEFGAEYPTLLPEGKYKAVLSVGYDEKVLTSAVDFIVLPAAVDRRGPDGRAVPRP